MRQKKIERSKGLKMIKRSKQGIQISCNEKWQISWTLFKSREWMLSKKLQQQKHRQVPSQRDLLILTRRLSTVAPMSGIRRLATLPTDLSPSDLFSGDDKNNSGDNNNDCLLAPLIKVLLCCGCQWTTSMAILQVPLNEVLLCRGCQWTTTTTIQPVLLIEAMNCLCTALTAVVT